MNRLSIRWRLTLWYGSLLACLLVLFGFLIFLVLKDQIRRRTDASLTEQAQAIASLIAQAGLDPSRPPDEPLDLRSVARPDSRIQLSEVDGEIRQQSGSPESTGLPPPGSLPGVGEERFELIDGPSGQRSRLITRRGEFGGHPVLIQVARTLTEDDQQLRELLKALGIGGALAILCAVGGGYPLARHALAPLDRMTRAADAITATRLNHRIEVPNPDDEFGRLARTLNRMTERLGASFHEVRRFTADAAHELRTPLAILRNEAEVALRIPRESEDYQVCLENMLEEIDHLSRLSEALLFLFREDAGQSEANHEPLRLDELVREAAEHMRVVASEKQQELTIEHCEEASILGRPQQIRRLIFNLLENAIKFTPEGGKITARIEQSNNLVRVTVEDTGIGIAPEHLPRVFDRFYRVDASRSSRSGGNGLGLSLCRSIAESHGGSIGIESQPERGTRVTVTLPAGPRGATAAIGRSISSARTTPS